jgi:hypothetical protein
MPKIILAFVILLFLSISMFAGKNPADYPLHIQIVESHWHRHGNGTVDGWGRVDIEDGDSIHGFDFTYESPGRSSEPWEAPDTWLNGRRSR